MSSFNDRNRGSDLVDLYIPGPDNASREECFNWHVTTRNFFAYVLGKPLVGLHMGQAFVDLQERMRIFRSEHVNNQQDFLDYAENQGYRDLVECTDYALASLFYAEHYRLREVWVDAFAHAVGMSDSIALSPEYLVYYEDSHYTYVLLIHSTARLTFDQSLDHKSAPRGRYSSYLCGESASHVSSGRLLSSLSGPCRRGSESSRPISQISSPLLCRAIWLLATTKECFSISQEPVQIAFHRLQGVVRLSGGHRIHDRPLFAETSQRWHLPSTGLG